MAESRLIPAANDLPPVAYGLGYRHGLGAGAYIFQSNYAEYLKSLLPYSDPRIEINIMIQPNSSPHIGTLCNLGLAFVVAQRMAELGMDAMVTCDLCDRAKGEQFTINGIVYQKSLKHKGVFQKHLPDYEELLSTLSQRYSVPYKLRVEEEFLKSDNMKGVLEDIITNRDTLGRYLAPTKASLPIRSACPKCGLMDKYGINNSYAPDASSVSFVCPHHGEFTISTDDTHQFSFNCQLLNLVIGYLYQRATFNYVEVMGSDYSGFWQEQLLYRFLPKPMLIVYTPLISDWSGAKVSKSLYLQGTAYDYLKRANLEYLLSYRILRQEGRHLKILWQEIERWVDEPYRLFRGYSLHYIHLLFEETVGDLLCQGTHKPEPE